MTTRNKLTIGAIQIGAAVALFAGVAGAAATGQVPGIGSGSSTTVRSAVSQDISGPCDEAEHANDPRCDGTVVTTGGDSSTTVTIDDKGGDRTGATTATTTGTTATSTHTSTTVDDHGGLRGGHGSDDGPSHDLNDDKGGLRSGDSSDDGPNHDLNDDHGGDSGHGSDDGPDHDVNDDHGGDSGHGGHGSDD